MRAFQAGIVLGLAVTLSIGTIAARNALAAAPAPAHFAGHAGTSMRGHVAVSPLAAPAGSVPAGVWQSDNQVLPTAGCHPHCSSDPSKGSDFGDPYNFSFSPHETPPAGYAYRYANPRFVSQWGNGCPFEVWNPFQSNAGGATLTAWARSEPCYFTVALDRFAVPL